MVSDEHFRFGLWRGRPRPRRPPLIRLAEARFIGKMISRPALSLKTKEKGLT
jgi:hypothetical protein